MWDVYSEICVCSHTFGRLFPSHMLLVLIEQLFCNTQHGTRSFTGAHVYCADISSALEILSAGFAPRLGVQFASGDLKHSLASSSSKFEQYFTSQKSTKNADVTQQQHALFFLYQLVLLQ